MDVECGFEGTTEVEGTKDVTSASDANLIRRLIKVLQMLTN